MDAQERREILLSIQSTVLGEDDFKLSKVDSLAWVSDETMKDFINGEAVLRVRSRKEGEVVSKEKVGYRRATFAD